MIARWWSGHASIAPAQPRATGVPAWRWAAAASGPCAVTNPLSVACVRAVTASQGAARGHAELMHGIRPHNRQPDFVLTKRAGMWPCLTLTASLNMPHLPRNHTIKCHESTSLGHMCGWPDNSSFLVYRPKVVRARQGKPVTCQLCLHTCTQSAVVLAWPQQVPERQFMHSQRCPNHTAFEYTAISPAKQLVAQAADDGVWLAC